MGRQARAQEDAGRWWLCDLTAAVLQAFPGRHTLRDFAAEVGIRQSTARERARMGRRYPKEFRRTFWPDQDTHSNVFYSHLRDALAIPDLQLAAEWLDLVSRDDLTVDSAAAQLPQWMEAKGLEVATDDDKDTPTKVTVCHDIATRVRSVQNVNSEWLITLVASETDPVMEQLKADLEKDYKHSLLKMTLKE